MAVLKFKDGQGVWHSIPAIQGASAYEQAQTAGYTGTLEDFYADLLALESAKTDAEAARDLALGYAGDAEDSASAAAASAMQLASGVASPAGTYADLAVLISANPNHSHIYVTTDSGYWYYWNGSAWMSGGQYFVPLTDAEFNYADSRQLLPLFADGRNILDTTERTLSSVIISGSNSAMNNFIASDYYIPVYPGMVLCGLKYWGTGGGGSLYRKDKTFLRQLQAADFPDGTGSTKFLIPSNAYYVRVFFQATEAAFLTKMIVVGSVYPQEFIPYGVVGLPTGVKLVSADIPDSGVVLEKIAPGAVDSTKIVDGTIKHRHMSKDLYDMGADGINILNPHTLVVGAWFDNKLNSVNGYYASDYTPVSPGQSIIGVNKLASNGDWFDENKQYLRAIATGDWGAQIGNYYPLTVPSGAYYLRTSLSDSRVNPMWVLGTDYPANYVVHGLTQLPSFMHLADSDIPENIMRSGGAVVPAYAPSLYYNKRIICFGDSIMAGAKIRTAIMLATGATTLDNYAVSGNSANGMYAVATGDGHPAKNYSDVDAVVIMIGHNQYTIDDSLTASGIKTESNYLNYPNTFVGYFCKTMEYIWAQNHSIRFYLCNIHLTDRGNWLRSAYIDTVVKEIADYYAQPFVDVYRECGIGAKNLSTYSSDGTHLTLNDFEGNAILGTYIGRQMNTK